MTIKTFLKENKIITTYSLLLVLTLFFLWIINYFNISYPLNITSTNASGELAVVGVGKVDAIPNSASVNLGVISNNATTVNDAQNQVNTVSNAIINALSKLGINKADIKTTSYSITPNYDYSKGKNNIIAGYNGNATITVKVKQTDKLAEIIASATSAGANEVTNTNYSIENPQLYQEQARAKAISNAKDQAKKIASELGLRLGRVVNIVEATNNSAPIPYMNEAKMGFGASSVTPNLQPGTQTITSTVTLYFDKR